MGRKGSGKTSTALSAVVAGGAALLENDRTAVVSVPGDGHLTALPVPLTMRIGRGTLEGLGWWELVVQAQGRLFSSSSAAATTFRAKANFARGELSREFGIRLCASAPIVGVVLPELDRGRSGPSAVEQVLPAETRRILRRFTYLPHDPGCRMIGC